MNIQSQTLQDLMELRRCYSEKALQRTEISATPSGDDVLQGLSSEVRRVSNMWPNHPLQQKLEQELSRTIQATVMSVLQDEQLVRREVDQNLALTGTSSSKSRARRRQKKYTTTTQTFLGKIYCSVSIWQKGGTQIIFRFVPSWMMTKIGLSKTLSVDLFGLYANGWQRALRIYNVSTIVWICIIWQ